MLDTATWRASPDWAPRRGYTMEQLEQANRAAVTDHTHISAISAECIVG
ncbi:MAG: hypothetical protein ACXW2C_00565 [Acidimicrobiia bacterium]